MPDAVYSFEVTADSLLELFTRAYETAHDLFGDEAPIEWENFDTFDISETRNIEPEKGPVGRFTAYCRVHVHFGAPQVALLFTR